MKFSKYYFIFTFCFSLLGSFFSFSQCNLIKNPSFEQKSACPTSYNQIYLANNWASIDSLANAGNDCNGEYFHTCGNWMTGIPYSTNGMYQYPKTGNALIGLILYVDLPNGQQGMYVYRNYAQGRLNQALTSGKNYCFKMWVNLYNISGYALDNIQAYFDNGSIDTARCGYPKAIVPQVANATGNIIKDTLNWILIKGSFVASGTERYVTIGNFFTDAQAQIQVFNASSGSHNIAYYLIDDVSLFPADLSAEAGRDTSMCKGDSLYIGRPPEIGLDNIWKEMHSGTQIGVGAGIWIKPDTSATYIVTQDLCGTITIDSIRVVVNCLGVAQYNMNNIVNIYPNPANEILNIESKTQNGELRIVDVLGKEIFKEIFFGKKQIQISNLNEGIYFINIKTTEGTIAKKIIITH
jgi:hypothetical protein